MISEGSCDTENWSKDAENSSLITEINNILKYITIEKNNLNCNNILLYYVFFFIKINLHKIILSKTLNNLNDNCI